MVDLNVLYGTLIVRSLKKNRDPGPTRRLVSTEAFIKTVPPTTFKADTCGKGRS